AAATTLVNALKGGHADLNTVLSAAQRADAQAYATANKKSVTLLSLPNVGQYGFTLNYNKAPLNNPDVRRAVSMAIDRKAMVSSGLMASTEPQTQPFAKGSLGYVPALNK